MKQSIIKQPKAQNKRKVSAEDCDAVATLIIEKRLTQKEACLQLGIGVRQFENWVYQMRNQQKFQESLSRIRAARVKTLVDSVEDAGFGRGGVRQDWRASAWLLQYGLPDSQFLPNMAASSQTLVVGNDRLLADIVSKVYSPEPAKIDTKTPAALPEPGQTTQDNVEIVQQSGIVT